MLKWMFPEPRRVRPVLTQASVLARGHMIFEASRASRVTFALCCTPLLEAPMFYVTVMDEPL